MSIAQFEEDKAQYVEQLDIVLSSLRDDPDSADLQALKEELQSAISMIEESIAEIRPKKTQTSQKQQRPPSPPPPNAASPSPEPEKWRREDHPAFKKAAPAAPSPPPPAAEEFQPEISYQVNDNVLAKWVSGDKGFYPGRITSVTGSSSARMYTVRFKSYDTVETLRARDIKPIAAPAQKRKADGTPVNSGDIATPQSSSSESHAAAGGSQQQQQQPPPPPNAAATRNSNGVVLSASPSMYPPQQPQDGGEEDGDAKPVKKFKKIKATKALEAGKNKWQDFNSKSKFGKTQKKDSMFRTPEGIHGRVGFTGSGQAMRKDASRSRHIYQPNEDAD